MLTIDQFYPNLSKPFNYKKSRSLIKASAFVSGIYVRGDTITLKIMGTDRVAKSLFERLLINFVA